MNFAWCLSPRGPRVTRFAPALSPRAAARRVLRLLILMSVLATCEHAHAQASVAEESNAGPVRITTEVEPRDVTIGSPFRYRIRIETEAGTQAVPRLRTGQIGEFVITDYGHSGDASDSTGRAGDAVPSGGEPNDGGTIEIWYELLAYESGSQFIPAPVVGYRTTGGEIGEVEGPRALINVDSLLPPPGTEVELRDIKAPVQPPPDRRPMILALIALLLIALVAVGVYLLQRSRRNRTRTVSRPAHEVALEALGRLRGARLIAAGRHGDYYVRLSGIVREYVEGRFAVRAPEMTTEEFLAAVGRGERLGREHRGALSGFLAEADLVKFARHVPSESDAERAYAAARGFVESTAPSESLAAGARVPAPTDTRQSAPGVEPKADGGGDALA